jgi:glyoxylase-like metal-dependent hydrolase (beta-lactamase superfamily II)
MALVDVVLPGYPVRTARGSIGYSSCTLVATEDGRKVLVDCATYADRTQFFEALGARGLTPEDIDILVLTHLHFDHCINARFFTRARVLVCKAEYDYANWALRQKPYGDPYTIDDPDGLLGPLKTEMVDGDTTLAPDLRLLMTPGHTPGAMSVLADTPEGRVAMASDAAKSISELITKQVFPSARVDHAQATRSIERLLSSADIIVPGHDRRVLVVNGQPRLEDIRDRPALMLYIY